MTNTLLFLCIETKIVGALMLVQIWFFYFLKYSERRNGSYSSVLGVNLSLLLSIFLVVSKYVSGALNCSIMEVLSSN